MKANISEKELSILRLPEKLPSIEVMEQLVLPSESNVMTSLQLDLTPYLEMPISCIGDSRFFVLGMVGPTQAGKSVFLQVAVADTISQAPGTCLYILPDKVQGIKQIHEKIIAPIKRTPQLSKYVVQPESKTLTNEFVKLSHMTLYLGWSNSPASLSSTPCTRVFFDEARLFKKELGNESNAIMLGLDRLTVARAMGLAQAYIVSTPSDEGDLLYQQLEVANTTVLYWYWKCPHCSKYMIPDFYAMVKPITKSEETSPAVQCHCKFCNGILEDRDKKRSLNGEGGYGYKGQDGQTELHIGELTERLFFRFDSMASPFRPFQMMYDEFQRTKKNINDFKNFHQAWLAKFWKLTQSTLTMSDLALRKGDYVKRIVPDGTKVITAGIDTQDDGFYVVVRAWGSDRETWLMDEFYISCRMNELPAKEIADLFKAQVEDRIWKTESGTVWKIANYAIDTGGHRTTEIYSVAEHLANMCLVKGRDDQIETIKVSSGVFGLFHVRTGDYLEETEIACTKSFWHLPKDVSDDFLNQWISAKKSFKVVNGKKKVVWDKASQNDYRYSDVHSYIALDLPWNNTTLRRNLEDPTWSHNPIVLAIEEEAETKSKEFGTEYDDMPESSKSFSFKW